MTPPTDPRELLKAYAEKQVTGDQVMRGLAAHKGWYVPALFAVDRLNSQVSDHSIVFSTEFDPNLRQLVLFTDKEAAHRADGYPLGVFSSAFSGSQVFAALGEQFDAASVNPCSPQAESWFIKQDAFALANLWGQVVELESALVTEPESEATLRRLAAHGGFLVLINDQNLPIDLTVPGIEGRCAAAFTAPDRHEDFMSKRSEADRARLKHLALSGAEMFQQLQKFDMAGILLNFGSQPVIIRKELFPRICAAA